MPGQVHTYFTGSEQNVFRGYKKELEGVFEDNTKDSATSGGDEGEVSSAYVAAKSSVRGGAHAD